MNSTFHIVMSAFLKWQLTKLKWVARQKAKTRHIFFCLVDHYEPGVNKVEGEIEKRRVQELLVRYPKIADRHKDYYGNIPKRTWFFPPHYHRYYNLKNLTLLCEKGYGEIELHLHHGKIGMDTCENLVKTINRTIREYGEFGIFGTQDGKERYGFIHGDWALDNSRENRYCGVNNEIEILKETGCYADFTFPSYGLSALGTNPLQFNSIFYAKDDPQKPKSYNTGKVVEKDVKETGDLMIIQGPFFPMYNLQKYLRIKSGSDAITGKPKVSSKRIDNWIATNIHIKGRENCIFVKTHTHGALYSEAVLGEEMGFIFRYLEDNYNDGQKYILHYITAREMYNIIKAIEANECDTEFESYKDYLVKKPNYNSSVDIEEASIELKNLIHSTYRE